VLSLHYNEHVLSVSCVAMDVSADLRELGRTPIAVVCAGAKSILVITTVNYLY
jgi:pseudouridine-5'-phosphate glycosidase